MNKASEQAQEMYALIKEALDRREWNYYDQEEDMSVFFGVNGEDLDMLFRIKVYDDLNYVAINSWLPTKIKSEDITEAAMIITALNYTLINGSFDMDLVDGEIVYRNTFIYTDCVFSYDAIYYLIDEATYQMDLFNDKLDDYANGRMTPGELLEFICKKGKDE